MSSSRKIAEFPDVEAKLQKIPTKQSAFERQKLEAEAKRRREAAETAAVYEDFVKSFDRDDNDGSNAYDSRTTPSRLGAGPPERSAFGRETPYGGGAGKRHFGASTGSLKSGPGSLGPAPSSFGKKRPYDGFQSDNRRDADEGRGRLRNDTREDSGPRSVSKVFDNASDDEEEAVPTTTDRAEEKAISKPTLRLANLPPNTSPAAIKALIPSRLTVENVKIVPPSGPSGPSGNERKSIAAIVTLSKETPATEIDATVSSLQNRYLGYGFYLSLHRHLSSAAIASGLTTLTSSATVAHPFGAKRVEEPSRNQCPSHGGYSRGFAPPPSYGPPVGGPLNRSGLLHVPIRPPRDIKKLRMIHKVIEAVLEHGPEFEALLMSRPDVQREEKWAWIWDARSEGGVWYRWRLWEIVTGAQSRREKGKYLPLFEGSHAWKVPDQPLAYEYTTGVDEFISDSEYNSSDEDDFEDEQNRQGEPGSGHNDGEDTFLNPIDKSKLAHLLARLPTTLSKIRKGDIARVTTFAITHASRGADEVVDMIVSNVETPFAYTSANPEHKQGGKDKESQDGDSRGASPAPDDKTATGAPDLSAARLVGLYVISDILSSSSTSGIRHAWRYRQLFEIALRNRKIFEVLGMMAEKLNWGRLRADKWKRSVGLVLSLWEGWCVFPVDSQEVFASTFENPPGAKKEESGNETERKNGGRWKTVDGSAADASKASGFLPVSEKPDTESDYVHRMLETGDTDGELGSPRRIYSSNFEVFSDDDLDGDPSQDFRMDTKMGEAEPSEMQRPGTDQEALKSVGGIQLSATKAAPSRKRMRAVDMFADSGSDEET
ncbi:U2 snRNP-associated SURP motif-containing protein [Diplogelasinospora grovesii]|uniref:U2 snRNP-associated SURP motif-containing protein n=1 Tax=Diplogelasinospora grovesii TaxID=303347 RepID=A0AAN6NI95_9PEZI|nr:U2 snRNP-associated SURP motif-containing protein [Diplogelasinospora grovesii]